MKRQLTSQVEKLDRLRRTNEKKFSAMNDEFEHRKKYVYIIVHSFINVVFR